MNLYLQRMIAFMMVLSLGDQLRITRTKTFAAGSKDDDERTLSPMSRTTYTTRQKKEKFVIVCSSVQM